jgi:hypothetical protein
MSTNQQSGTKSNLVFFSSRQSTLWHYKGNMTLLCLPRVQKKNRASRFSSLQKCMIIWNPAQSQVLLARTASSPMNVGQKRFFRAQFSCTHVTSILFSWRMENFACRTWSARVCRHSKISREVCKRGLQSTCQKWQCMCTVKLKRERGSREKRNLCFGMRWQWDLLLQELIKGIDLKKKAEQPHATQRNEAP